MPLRKEYTDRNLTKDRKEKPRMLARKKISKVENLTDDEKWLLAMIFQLSIDQINRMNHHLLAREQIEAHEYFALANKLGIANEMLWDSHGHYRWEPRRKLGWLEKKKHKN